MSVAFTKENSAETASEILLPDRAISAEPNLVTPTRLEALHSELEQARLSAYVEKSIGDGCHFFEFCRHSQERA